MRDILGIVSLLKVFWWRSLAALGISPGGSNAAKSAQLQRQAWQLRDQCVRFLACGYPRQADGNPPAVLMLFTEGFNRCGFVVLDIEDRIEFGDLQQVVDFLGQVE